MTLGNKFSIYSWQLQYMKNDPNLWIFYMSIQRKKDRKALCAVSNRFENTQCKAWMTHYDVKLFKDDVFNFCSI